MERASGAALAIDDPLLLQGLEAASGRTLQLLHLGRGCFDTSPLSVVSRASLAAVCGAAGLPADVRRFRANLVLELDDPAPFQEEAWVGRTLCAPSGARLRLDRRIERCMVPTLDPEDFTATPGLLRHLAQARQACLGLHATIEAPGVLREGEALRLG